MPNLDILPNQMLSAYAMGRQVASEDEKREATKKYSNDAVMAWSTGDKQAFRNNIAQLSTVDRQAAAGMINTFGNLDRTNFVESAYHVYNAVNSTDPKAVNMSLLRAIETLSVQPNNPFAKGLKDIVAMPEGEEKERKILAAYNYANQLGAYGNPIGDSLAREKLAVQQGNLMMRLKEYELDKSKEGRIAKRQAFIDEFGDVPENFYRDPNDPRKIRSKPGSITYEKRQGEKQKRLLLYNENINKGDRLIKQIEGAIDDTSIWTTGTLGAFLKYIPGLKAADMQSIITTITANIGFDKLQDMRLQSPTGGALGQVAIQELEALQASIANLQQSQSPTQMKANLQMVLDHYKRFLKNAKSARIDLEKMGPDDLYSSTTNRLFSESQTVDLKEKSTTELLDLF